MDAQTYTQMLALQQQKGAPLVSQGHPQQRGPMVPKYDSNNPLGEGSMKAVQAARKSLGGQKPGMFHDLLGMANRFAIHRLRDSNTADGRALGQAFKTPEETAAENYQMMQFLQAQEMAKERQALQQQKMMQDMAYRNAMLEERRSHHNSMKRTQDAHADYYRAMAERARDKGNPQGLLNEDMEMLQEIAPGAIPYSGRTAAERSAFTKELRERANKPASEVKVLHTLDKMNDIVKEYPDLSTSLAAAMFPDKFKGGAVSTFSRKFMPKEKRAALEKLDKLANDLVMKQVHGLGGQRASIFLEKIMQSSNPHYGLSPDAVKAIRDNFKEEYDISLRDSKAARSALKGNYYIPMMAPEYQEPEEERVFENSPDLSRMSNEELLRLIQVQ